MAASSEFINKADFKRWRDVDQAQDDGAESDYEQTAWEGFVAPHGSEAEGWSLNKSLASLTGKGMKGSQWLAAQAMVPGGDAERSIAGGSDWNAENFAPACGVPTALRSADLMDDWSNTGSKEWNGLSGLKHIIGAAAKSIGQ
jgi:hypothetical protein